MGASRQEATQVGRQKGRESRVQETQDPRTQRVTDEMRRKSR